MNDLDKIRIKIIKGIFRKSPKVKEEIKRILREK